MQRPAAHESAEFYHKYINRVPEIGFYKQLELSLETSSQLLKSLSHEKWNYRYAPGKWSLKEAWIHVIDTERIMAYRALCIARGDKTPLPGFDQDAYVPYSHAEERSPESIIEEYEMVRKSTLAMLSHFTEDMLSQLGSASNNPITARALAYIIAGHELHHLAIIREHYLA